MTDPRHAYGQLLVMRTVVVSDLIVDKGLKVVLAGEDVMEACVVFWRQWEGLPVLDPSRAVANGTKGIEDGCDVGGGRNGDGGSRYRRCEAFGRWIRGVRDG